MRRWRLTVSGAERIGRGEDAVLVVIREPARLGEVCWRERLRERCVVDEVDVHVVENLHVKKPCLKTKILAK